MKQLVIVVLVLALTGCAQATPEPTAVPTVDACQDEMVRFVAYADGVVPEIRGAYDALSEGNPAIDLAATKALIAMSKLQHGGLDVFPADDCTAPEIERLRTAAESIGAFGEKQMALSGGWDEEQAAALAAVLDLEVRLAELNATY